MKTYTKKYPNLPTEAVDEIYLKYRFIFENLGNDKELRVPEVVAHEKENISFNHISLREDDSLRTMMCSLPHKEVERTFFLVGEHLAKLHQTLQLRGYIHGDCWAGNIFFQNETVTFIDFEPPHSTSVKWKDAIYGDVEDDLAHFIVLSDTLFPRRNWYKYPLRRVGWYKAFLEGYKEAGGTYDSDKLKALTRRKFKTNFKSVLRSSEYTVGRKVGAIVLRVLVWMFNPYVRS